MAKRFFRHGELPLVALALLEQQPGHAYDVLNRLSLLFADRYEPSPGTIYPALTALEAEGLIVGTPSDRRVVYALTEEGHVALRERLPLLQQLEDRLQVSLRESSATEASLQALADVAREASRTFGDAEVARVLKAVQRELEMLRRKTARGQV